MRIIQEIVVIAVVTQVANAYIPTRVWKATRCQARNSRIVGRNTKDNADELKDLRLDESTLSEEEKQRLQQLRVDASLKEVEEIEEELKKKFYASTDDDMKGIEVVDTRWSGQADMDVMRQSERNIKDVVARPGLAMADIVAFLLFSYIGRANHGDPQIGVQVLTTAAPFLLAWFLVAPLLGSYTSTVTDSQLNSAKAVIPSWAIALPLAILIRAIFKQEVPPTIFIAISMGATLAILGIERSIMVKTTPPSDANSKRGGIFDNLRMITTLIKRW